MSQSAAHQRWRRLRGTSEVARRLGHSVQTLVSTYVGALDGNEHIGNTRIEAALTDDP